jgi:predicted murein hydrolase (TIGR00659 family)
LCAYVLGDLISARLRRPAWAHPVIISVALLIVLLWATGTNYDTYFQGAQFVHFLLGPATVALAVPLLQQFPLVRRLLVPLAAALAAGSVTAIVSAVGVSWALGASPVTVASIAPKSVTTPIAMAVAQGVGGLPALAATFVVITGILGAVCMGPWFRLLRVRGFAARGLAAGVACHGIGTAQAFQLSPLSGAFAGLGLALNGVLTSLLVPALLSLLGWVAR